MSFFFPESMLIREDFPTLDLPTKANSGRVASGQVARSAKLASNSAEWICMG